MINDMTNKNISKGYVTDVIKKHRIPVVSCVLGINEGYFHNNNDNDDVTKIIQDITEDYFQKTGKYISINATSSTAIYRKEWGCPQGGEKTFTLTCTPNIKFYKEYEYDKFIEDSKIVMVAIAAHFKQSTLVIQVEDKDTCRYEFLYLK